MAFKQPQKLSAQEQVDGQLRPFIRNKELREPIVHAIIELPPEAREKKIAEVEAAAADFREMYKLVRMRIILMSMKGGSAKASSALDKLTPSLTHLPGKDDFKAAAKELESASESIPEARKLMENAGFVGETSPHALAELFVAHPKECAEFARALLKNEKWLLRALGNQDFVKEIPYIIGNLSKPSASALFFQNQDRFLQFIKAAERDKELLISLTTVVNLLSEPDFASNFASNPDAIIALAKEAGSNGAILVYFFRERHVSKEMASHPAEFMKLFQYIKALDHGTAHDDGPEGGSGVNDAEMVCEELSKKQTISMFLAHPDAFISLLEKAGENAKYLLHHMYVSREFSGFLASGPSAFKKVEELIAAVGEKYSFQAINAISKPPLEEAFVQNPDSFIGKFRKISSLGSKAGAVFYSIIYRESEARSFLSDSEGYLEMARKSVG